MTNNEILALRMLLITIDRLEIGKVLKFTIRRDGRRMIGSAVIADEKGTWYSYDI